MLSIKNAKKYQKIIYKINSINLIIKKGYKMLNAKIRNAFSEKKIQAEPIIGESRTQQHMKDESDINIIVEKHLKTGRRREAQNNRQPMYGDFTSVDYMEMRNAIVDIDQEFAGLPSRIRSRFNNDPHQLIRFVEKPENLQESINLGLLPNPNPGPDPVPLTPDRPTNPANPPAAPFTT